MKLAYFGFMNMLEQTTHRKLCALALFLVIPLLTTAKTYINELDEVFQVSEGDQLVVDVGRGNVQISSQPGDQLTVKVTMSIKAKDDEAAEEAFERIETVLKRSDKAIIVTAKDRKSKGSWLKFAKPKKARIAVSIQCPESCDVQVDTGSGNIKIRGVTGNLSFDTGSGNIIGDRLNGEIYADTGSGNIVLSDVDGLVVGDTGSGNIILKNFSGSLSGDTGSGNIEASGAIVSFEADTGSGNVSVHSMVALSGDSVADTGSGNVSIHLPENSSFLIDASTSSGRIQNEFPTTQVQSSGKRHLKASVNVPGPALTVDCGSGNISLKIAR